MAKSMFTDDAIAIMHFNSSVQSYLQVYHSAASGRNQKVTCRPVSMA